MPGRRTSGKQLNGARRLSTLLFRAAVCFAAGLLLWLTACVCLFVAPRTDLPKRADVLFVLAPQGDRTQYAKQLMDQGIAETLALSVPQGRDDHDSLCNQNNAYRIVCFDPDPVTTRGEARALQRLAEEHGWQSANVLTAQFHVSRARILLQRCYNGNIAIIAFPTPMPLLEFPNVAEPSWMYHFLYESAAFVKVALEQDC